MNNPFTICNDYGCGIPRVHYPVAVALFQMSACNADRNDKPENASVAANPRS